MEVKTKEQMAKYLEGIINCIDDDDLFNYSDNVTAKATGNTIVVTDMHTKKTFIMNVKEVK